MDILINAILGGVISYFLASFILAFYKVYSEAKRVTDEQIIAALDAKIHRVRQEKDAGMFYWYDHDDGNFIAQGRTIEEIQTVLKAHWQRHVFVISDTEMIMGPEFNEIHIYSTEKA